MAILTVEFLKDLIENVPEEYIVCHEAAICNIIKTEKVEIDTEEERIVFK